MSAHGSTPTVADMRPQFHFTARRGWINDPHAVTARDGGYHAFFQYVPDSMIWGPNCQWGHASGPDLFSLQELDVALAPGEGDDGIWTGSLVRDGTHDRIFYTSTIAPDFGIGRVRVARPDDDGWRNWTKEPGTIAEVPDDLDVIAFRDPFVFQDGAQWRMFVGAALRDGTAAALGYSSSDLETWTYDGIAAQRSSREASPIWMGALWECPQVFSIGDSHILLTSVWDDDVLHYAGYGVGRLEDGRFTAEHWGQLSYGRSYYAPTFFRDADGEPCVMFWMRGVRDDHEQWSGAHSIPYRLSLQAGQLVPTPHPDLERYVVPAEDGDLMTESGLVEWSPAPSDTLTLSGDGAQLMRLEVTPGRIVAFGAGEPSSMPYDGSLVHVIVDGPIVEIVTRRGLLGTPISRSGAPIAVDTGHPTRRIHLLRREAT